MLASQRIWRDPKRMILESAGWVSPLNSFSFYPHPHFTSCSLYALYLGILVHIPNYTMPYLGDRDEASRAPGVQCLPFQLLPEHVLLEVPAEPQTPLGRPDWAQLPALPPLSSRVLCFWKWHHYPHTHAFHSHFRIVSVSAPPYLINC